MNKIPEHIAIIMDGNGRWAKALGKIRTQSHYQGVKNVRNIAIYANELGVKCLTLYAFSTENWKRPLEEVNYLMALPKFFFDSYIKELMAKNIKVMMIGEMDSLPKEAKAIFARAIDMTKDNTGMILNFALNYGSHQEILRAAKNFALDVLNDKSVLDIDEDAFSQYLYTKDLPVIDLLIRTGGEVRLSNFLLYQLAYSELVFIDTLWPDFDNEAFDECLKIYYQRDRRFGGLNEKESY